MDHWTEIRTAYSVARMGTVSKATLELGVHRATVNRHIDALEAEIGTRLFLRHRRGYELTDTSREFLQVAERSYNMLQDFFGRVRVQSADIEGEVIVATLFPLTNLILPAIPDFRRRHPKKTCAGHNRRRSGTSGIGTSACGLACRCQSDQCGLCHAALLHP